jgi:hypothetical protein
MNVEKTIEFILEAQAKTEGRSVKNEERWAKAGRRLDRLAARVGKLISFERISFGEPSQS